MSSPAFAPTTFNQGAPPQVSAAELNKLGAGVRDAAILPAYAGTNPELETDANRVVWKKASSGAMVAYAHASDAGVIELAGRPAAAGGSSAAVLRAEAHPSDAIQDAYIEIVNVPSNGTTKRYINAVVKGDSGAPGNLVTRLASSDGKPTWPSPIELWNDAGGPSPTQGNTNVPFSKTFTKKGDGPMFIAITATLIPGATGFMSYDVKIDGTHIEYLGQYFNRTGQHETLVHPGMTVTNATLCAKGNHTITLTLGGSGVTADANDRARGSLIEFPA